MVISVISDLSSLIQQHIAEVPVPLYIFIGGKRRLHLIRILLDHQPGVADAVLLSQIIYIPPPDLRIEV